MVQFFLLSALCLTLTAQPATASQGATAVTNPAVGLSLLLCIAVLIHTFLHKRKTTQNRLANAYLHGITGWLLLYILSSLFSNGIDLLTYVLVFLNPSEHSEPEAILAIYLVAGVGAALVLPYLYGIYMLCTFKRNAVRVNIILLALQPLLILVLPLIHTLIFAEVLPWFFLSFEAVLDGYEPFIFFLCVRSVIFSAIWIAYFTNSRRVKYTYKLQ